MAALAPHIDALVAQGPPQAWADASSLFLADAAGALAAAAEKVDNGWFGTGLLKGVDPWGAWRGFIQGSIVATHDFLVAQGVKENAWGLALMLFTFSLRALTLPLTWFQFASTEKQKALAPIMADIKEKYPTNPEMQNMLIAKLYEDTGSNPLAGCLPPLLQIPVFIGLYRSILNLANDKVLEEPFFFLPSLEGPTLTDQLQLPQGRGIQWLTEQWSGTFDPSQFPGDLEPMLGWDATLAYCAIPIIITLTQFAVQSVTAPVPTGEEDRVTRRTQALLKYIPLMIGYFALCVPAALCLYWFTSNTFTGLTTVTIKKYYEANPPQVDWDFLTKDDSTKNFNLEMPANIEEALADARLNIMPPREQRRVTLALAAADAPPLN